MATATPQQRYYLAHREELLPKMREREKSRRVSRQSTYAENPEAHETDKAKMRQKYYARVARANKKLIDTALADPTTDEKVRTRLLAIAEDSSAFTTSSIRQMISPPTHKTMPRGVKKVVEEKKEGEVVVPVMEGEAKKVEEKKEKKEKAKKVKRVIVKADDEEIIFKVEKGVTVHFH